MRRLTVAMCFLVGLSGTAAANQYEVGGAFSAIGPDANGSTVPGCPYDAACGPSFDTALGQLTNVSVKIQGLVSPQVGILPPNTVYVIEKPTIEVFGQFFSETLKISGPFFLDAVGGGFAFNQTFNDVDPKYFLPAVGSLGELFPVGTGTPFMAYDAQGNSLPVLDKVDGTTARGNIYITYTYTVAEPALTLLLPALLILGIVVYRRRAVNVRRLTLAISFVLGLSATAKANELVVDGQFIAGAVDDPIDNAVAPYFDPALGQLTNVSVKILGSITSDVGMTVTSFPVSYVILTPTFSVLVGNLQNLDIFSTTTRVNTDPSKPGPISAGPFPFGATFNDPDLSRYIGDPSYPVGDVFPVSSDTDFKAYAADGSFAGPVGATSSDFTMATGTFQITYTYTVDEPAITLLLPTLLILSIVVYRRRAVKW